MSLHVPLPLEPKNISPFEPNPPSNKESTPLEGRVLRGVRLVLACVAVYAILANLSGLGFRIVLLQSGESAAVFADSNFNLLVRLGSSALVALIYCVFAVTLAWHKANQGFAALTALTLFTISITCIDLAPSLVVPGWGSLQPAFSAINVGLLMYWLLLFPHGRFASRGNILLGHGWALFCFLCWAFKDFPFNVVYLEGWVKTPVLSLLFDFSPFVYAMNRIVRRRKYSPLPLERKQAKWFFLGASAIFCGLFGNSLLNAVASYATSAFAVNTSEHYYSQYFFEVVRPVVLALVYVLLPIALGVAHYRHRLFGGEVVVEYTLTYLALALLLVGVYVALVWFNQQVPNGYSSSLVLVVSAAGVSLVLQPARSGLQRQIRRLLHGERRNPYTVLLELSQHLERSIHPQAALEAIAHTLQHRLRLPAGEIRMALPQEARVMVAWGKAQIENRLEFVLVAEGRHLGVLWIASPRSHFSQEELQLLSQISQYAARAMQALSLTLELQRSREQRVEAFEAERKRLRNELHDGIAPSLVGWVRRMDVALDSGETERPALLEQVQDGLLGTVRELRKIIYGLRPPALDELGLWGALAEICARSSVAVTLSLPEKKALSAALEVAIYRIASEALHNVHKHAQASQIWLTLEVEKYQIILTVTDDGKGISVAHGTGMGTGMDGGMDGGMGAGIGMHSMLERASELGGTLRISPRVADNTNVADNTGTGTTLTVTLPFWEDLA
jgi:signal transduction histidine kinase